MLRLTCLLLLASALATPASAQDTPDQPDRIAPAAAEPLFIAALSDLYTGNPARAATRLSDVLTAFPDDPIVLDALAEAYLAQDLSAEALFHAEMAATLAPDDAAIQRRLADALDASGDANRAQQVRDTARRLDPEAPEPPTPRPSPARPESAPAGSTDTQLPGAAAYEAGRYAEAADALLEVIDSDPRQMTAWALALDALARTSDDRAGDTADLARLLYPTVPSILIPAANALRAAGRTADARDAVESALRALDAGPDDAGLRQRADALLSSLR